MAAPTIEDLLLTQVVSTHSHPKVAAADVAFGVAVGGVSTHSHPKVAAGGLCFDTLEGAVSTHSHPKVAASWCEKSWK